MTALRFGRVSCGGAGAPHFPPAARCEGPAVLAGAGFGCPRRAGASRPCQGTGWGTGMRLHTPALRKSWARSRAPLCPGRDSTHKKNKTGTEVFLLSFKCQSGMVWDSAGARPSRVRGAQVLGLSRLKKGLVTCNSSEIWRAAQPVRRLSKLHFDRETPACWMTAYFLMLSHNKSAPEHWKV